MVSGYTGKVLRVNLSKSSIHEEPTDPAITKGFLGGRGYAAKLLYDNLPLGAEPLSPDNLLIFSTGPLTGTIIPAAVKFAVTSLSPLTNMYGFTMSSGFFAPEMKAAGYDHLIIEGRAEKPVYLWINNEVASIRAGQHLWGLTTTAANQILKEELGQKTQTAVIGPAGEHRVKYSSIIVGNRAGGRCGMGAVMGSKNLKAVAVRGEGKISVFDPTVLLESTKEIISTLRTVSPACDLYPKYGTTYFMGSMNSYGVLPVKNYQESGVYEAITHVDEHAFKGYVIKDSTCLRCPIVCEKITAVKEGPYGPVHTFGPQYETIWAFSAQCGIDRMDAVIAANALCNDLGLDTVSTGNVIGFSMECAEKGLFNVNGIDLRFGNHEVLLPLIRKISYLQDEGSFLAQGVKVMAERIGKGSDKFAIHVKGMELPAYDPRPIPGMALAFSTASRGGCHLRAWTIADELSGKVPIYSTEGRAKLVLGIQNLRTFIDSSGMCLFAMKALPLPQLAKAVNLVTGMNLTPDEALKIGERVYNLERLLLARSGITRDQDVVADRFFDESLKAGPHAGQKLSRASFEAMKDEYYDLRGWDLKNGLPTNEKLKDLDLA
jgi:aldehyde:ferredoxin oxidoreductase